MKKLLLLLVTTICLASAGSAQISTFPYYQDFETFTTCTNSCNAACALTAGWINDATENGNWIVDVGGTSSGGTGPSIDYDPGTPSGKYLYFETSSPCYPNATAILHVPVIDMSGVSNLRMVFGNHMFGASMGSLYVEVSIDGGSTYPDLLWTKSGDQGDIWFIDTVDLIAYSGLSDVRVRFRGVTTTSFTSDMAIDAVQLYEALALNAGVNAFLNPSIPTCNFNDSVTVQIKNWGTDTLVSANIDWEWNAVGQPTTAWTGSLAPGSLESVYIGSVVYGVGDNLKAWTSLPNGLPESPSGASNDTTEILGIIAGLTGTYTIGGATPDYVDFASAIVDLVTYGVCGPTAFDVRTGTYPEQFTLNTFIGMSMTNTVTFRSEAGHRDSVIIEYAAFLSTDNYVIRMDGADYFNFEQMTVRNTGLTYGRVLDFLGGSDYNTFSDNRLHTTAVTTTSTNVVVIYGAAGSNDNYNTFDANTIEGGSYGAYWYGTSTISLEEGTVFNDNIFLNNYYYASRLYYLDAPTFTGNSATGASTYTGTRWAYYFFYCDNGSIISGNSCDAGTSMTGWRYGIYLTNCDATVTGRGLVSNNMVQLGVPASIATEYGIYFSNTGFFDVYNNSIHLVSNGVNSRGFYGTSGGANTLTNNNIAVNGPGYAIYLASNYTVTEMDYNNLYSPLGNVGYYNSAAQLTFADWQSASGFDVNGLSVDPQFVSMYDLHVCGDSLNGMGIPLALITDDFDGQPRDASTPDVGADEHAPLNTNFLGSDVDFCVGETITLWAGSPADTVVWSTGDTSNMITVTTAGTYDVVVTGSCGTGFDTIVISASALVYTNFLEADTLEICTGGSATLSSNMPADTYLWTGGTSAPTLVVTAGGTYQLDITDACGSGSETIVVVEYTDPLASFTWVNSFATAIFTNTTGANGNPTYAWDFGDSNSSADSDPTHVYSVIGTYWVTLTVTNACGTSTYGDSVTLSSVGLTDLFAAGDVSIFPNPSKGAFTISMDLLTSADVTIEIENVLGAIVYESTPGAIEGLHTEVVDLKGAPAGMYFVRILAGDKQLVKKIILE